MHASLAHARPAKPAANYAAARSSAYAHVEAKAWAPAEASLAGLADDPRFGLDDWIALATSRFWLGRHEDMLAAAERALALDPQSLRAAHLATIALSHQHRWAEALVLFERHRGNPDRQHYQFLVNHATALSQLERHREALDVYLEAMVLQITDPLIHMRVGVEMRMLHMYAEAAESFQTAWTLDPKRFAAQLLVMHMRQYACAWDGFDQASAGIVQAMAAMREDQPVRTEGAIWSLTAIEHPPVLFRRAARQMAISAAHEARPLPPRAVSQDASRRIRVGYLSSDFHNHATTHLIVEALEARDTARFEVVLYSHGKNDGSPEMHRVRAACERLVDASAMSDRQLAQRIRDDGIDILVDLKGHTHGNRLAVFAYRPAPVQATFLGFPGTTGADYIDYFIGDRWVTPLEHAAHYSEKIAQMPHSYQPNDSRRTRPVPMTRQSLGMPEDALVIGNFNQSFKLSPATFDSWMRIMRAVPRAVLWLLADNNQAVANLQREAQARGVDPSRIVFAPRIHMDDHLARLPLVDFMLDNWPCNSHTTAADALWMGVPMVTLMGETFASRVAGSLLEAVGLGELVCTDAAQYEALAIALLNDRPRVQAMRRHLEEGRASFPLFDGRRFAADLEGLYLRMMERARQGLPPVELPAVGG